MARAPIGREYSPDIEYTEDHRSNLIKAGVAVFAVISALIAFTVLFGSWYTVGFTERAVLTRNGDFVGVSEPGLHFKTPLIEDYYRMSNLPSTYTWGKIAAYSKDQQPADMKVSITYHIGANQVGDYYKEFGSDEESILTNFVSPRLQKDLKEIFGSYTAAESIQRRAELGKEVQNSILASLAGKPIVIDGVQIENIDFSNAYEQAVESRMQAEVDVAKQEQTLRRKQIEAQMALATAEGEANSTKAKAEANAYSTKINGEAEAAAIKAKSDALKDNPNYIQYVQATSWDGKLPQTMLPGNSVPMIALDPKK